MENEIIVSIIIAAYNIENYIERCLNSVINQTFESIEIIIVNDGSTDSTLENINKFKDDRIKIYSQENKGLIEARKSGFNIAKGEYILFIDGDDWLELDAIKKLYEKAKVHNDDIILYNSIWAYENRKIRKELFLEESLSCNRDLLKEILIGNIMPAVWGKFIRRKYIIENRINFPENLSYGEDLGLVLSLFIHNPKVNYISDYLYNYYQREDSITNSKESNKVLELEQVVEFIKKELIKNNLFDTYKEEYEFMVFNTLHYRCFFGGYIKSKTIHKELYYQCLSKNIDLNNDYIKEKIKKLTFISKFKFNLYTKNYTIGYLFDKLLEPFRIIKYSENRRNLC